MLTKTQAQMKMANGSTHCPPPFYYASRDADALRDLEATLLALPGTPTFEQVQEVLRTKISDAMVKRRHEHERNVLRTFPNLVCFPPSMSMKEIYKYIKRSSVLTGEVKRFRSLYWKMQSAAEAIPKNLDSDVYQTAVLEAKERALFERYLKPYRLKTIGFEATRTTLRTAIANIHQYIQQILYAFFPINRRKQLEYDASVTAAHTMPQLFDLILQPRGNGVFEQRIPLQARVVATLAQLEFEYLISPHNPDNLDSIRNELLHVFNQNVFVPGELRRVIVVAELDPNNYYRVKRKSDGKFDVAWLDDTKQSEMPQTSETRFVLPLLVNVIRMPNGKEILVHFDTRRKVFIFAKQLRKLYRESDHVTDLSGLSLILLNTRPEEEEYLADLLRNTVVNCPGLVSAQDSNASRAGTIDQHNPFSSPDRTGEKYDFRWGVKHELQILTLPYFVNSLVAHALDGHPFYKLLTYLDTLFPWIWPTSLFGIDWYDPRIRDMLWQHQCRMLQAA